MSIVSGAQCMQCHLERSMEQARAMGTEEQATVFFKELLKMFLSFPEGVSAPCYIPEITRLMHEIYGADMDRYREEKRASNAFVLKRMDAIRQSVTTAADPVLAGLQHAILGNYIDFSALRGQVSFERLDEMLAQAHHMELDAQTYASLRSELRTARRLLYITDNAGEIGFDRIFAEELAKAFPQLQITFLVRGGPAMNDALEEDARQVGIPFPVMGNGNPVPGTVPELLSPEARQALENADVVISKGQGNVETLWGCGLNIYYAFLVKCPRFQELFQQPRFTPMLLKERQ